MSGRRLGEKTVAGDQRGAPALVEWAAQWPRCAFALEDCRHLTRRLERDLLAAGQRGGAGADPADGRRPSRRAASRASPTRSTPRPSRWPRCASRTCRWPSWTARPGRSSCWSTTAATWSPSGPACNRLRWHLHELDPTLQVPSAAACAATASWTTWPRGWPASRAWSPGSPRELVARCRELTGQINALERELGALVRRLAPGAAGRARLRRARRRGDRRRDRRARTGSGPRTPTPGSPAPPRSRSGPAAPTARSGSTAAATGAINCALHMIAVTQARGIGPGQDYIDKALARGKTRTEAVRLLRRRALRRRLPRPPHRRARRSSCQAPAAAVALGRGRAA